MTTPKLRRPLPKSVKARSGGDAFILTPATNEKSLGIPEAGGQEFRATITLHWEEFRDVNQRTGTLWLEYQLGRATGELPGIQKVAPIHASGAEHQTFVIVTPGNVRIYYNGEAKAHVWVSYFAEYLG